LEYSLMRSNQVPFPRSHIRTALTAMRTALTVLLIACQGDSDTGSPRRATLSVPDSIRARRLARLAIMPDTFGARVDSARVLGTPSANLWIVVVSDFQCPACRAFALDVLPAIRREFVDAARARLAFMNLPQDTHFNARFAAHASLCAASAGRFWEMHDSLFANQARWARLDDPRPYFDSLAVASGVPAGMQAQCTARQPLLRLLTEDIERSRASGARTVPTVFVGNRRLAERDLTVAGVRRAVQAELAR
jgi:protein-disulfide isomerase